MCRFLKHLLQDYEVQGTAAITVGMPMSTDKCTGKKKKQIKIFLLSSPTFTSPALVLMPVDLALPFTLQSALNSLGFVCLF